MQHRFLLAAILVMLASPAVADPDPAPGNDAIRALLSALDKGVAADVVAALGVKVKVDGAVFGDAACDKAFGGTRTVRGSKRTKLADCLVAAWKAKASASEPVVAVAGKGWTATLEIGADRYVVALAAGKGGVARVAGITVNGGAPKPDPEAPKVAFFMDKNSKALDAILNSNLSTDLSKFQGIKGGTGTGRGTGTGVGVGDDIGTGTTKGKGTGGGGSVDGDFVSKGSIDGGTAHQGTGTGPRPRDVTIAVGDAGGDFGGFTADEIQRVVKARAGVFRACYQKELNRSPGIAGKIIVGFAIAEDGTVASAAVRSTTMKNEAVESCLRSNVLRLRFPAKGNRANVTYPFVFSSEGG